jgi:SPOR domain
MLKKILTITIIVFCVHASALAQYDSTLVEISADYRLDLLAKKQAQINKVSVYKNSSGQWKGYRVMVLNTNNRDLAYKTRADILRFYPDKGVYMAYQAPYFKLKAGDFVKKEDAEKFRKELSKYFKDGLFVMNDIIKISSEDEAKILAEKEEKNY